MKDIVITSKGLLRELLWFLAAFVIAFSVNVYAVLKYSRPAVELISQIGYVFAIALVIWVLLLIIRLIIYILISLIKKK